MQPSSGPLQPTVHKEHMVPRIGPRDRERLATTTLHSGTTQGPKHTHIP